MQQSGTADQSKVSGNSVAPEAGSVEERASATRMLPELLQSYPLPRPAISAAACSFPWSSLRSVIGVAAAATAAIRDHVDSRVRNAACQASAAMSWPFTQRLSARHVDVIGQVDLY
ncbi:hypothetical protein CKAH01_02760 [Colletotrichum kahawae]|uniref:Uncharacterized protein n=1 Tax=Colletotrichum kahawae TaxID=34407 RepID=A0AAD9XWL5_COLKA|nr:hypothetical protein CKAH01_02760 [Colletotrichum kahawae]